MVARLNPLMIILSGDMIRNAKDYISVLLFMLAFPFWIWGVKKEWRAFVFMVGCWLLLLGVKKEDVFP